MNVTHSSFVLHWQPGYDGGSRQLFYISLNSSDSTERGTSAHSLRFDDLVENAQYQLKIRSRNDLGMSDYSSHVIVVTKPSPIRSDEFPAIHRAYYSADGRRIRFQLSPLRSAVLSLDQLCIEHYNLDEMAPCVPLYDIESLKDGLQIQINQSQIRLKLCVLNQTDVCSKSISVPTALQLSNHTSDMFLVLTGKAESNSPVCMSLGMLS